MGVAEEQGLPGDDSDAEPAMDAGVGMDIAQPAMDAEPALPIAQPGAPALPAAPTQVLLSAARRDFFRLLQRGLTAGAQSVLSEHLALLRGLALALPVTFPGLAALANAGDEEADFWLNAAHIQLHRRARAAARLGQRLADPGFALGLGAGVLLDVLVPLLLAMALEGAGSGPAAPGASSNPATGAREGDVSRLANVADAAAGALGALGAALPWPAYAQVLGRAMRLLRTHAAGPAAKPAVRAVCVLLDNFHFLDAPESGDGGGTERAGIHSTLLKCVCMRGVGLWGWLGCASWCRLAEGPTDFREYTHTHSLS